MTFSTEFYKILKEEVDVCKTLIEYPPNKNELDNIFCVLDEDKKDIIIKKIDSKYFNNDFDFIYKKYPNFVYHYLRSKDNNYIKENYKSLLIKGSFYSNIDIVKHVLNTLELTNFEKIIDRQIINAVILGGSIEILDLFISLNNNIVKINYLSKKLIPIILYNQKWHIYEYIINKYYKDIVNNTNLFKKWIYKYTSFKEKQYENLVKNKKTDKNIISKKEYLKLDMFLNNLTNKIENIKINMDEDLLSKLYYYTSEEWIEKNIDKFEFDKQIYLKTIYSYKNNNKYYVNFYSILSYLENKNCFKHLPIFEDWLLINNHTSLKNLKKTDNKRYKYYQDIFNELIKDIKYITPKSKLNYENLMNKDVLNYLLNKHFEELKIMGFLNSILDYIFMSNSLHLIKELSDFISPRSNFYLFAIDKIGNTESIKYLIDINTPKNKNICEFAAINGKKDILGFLHQNNFPWDELTPNAACINNHFNCLEYALNNGCKWNPQSWMYIHQNMEKYFKTKMEFMHSLKTIKKEDEQSIELAKEYNLKLEKEYEQLILTINFIKKYEKDNNIETPIFEVVENIKNNENKEEIQQKEETEQHKEESNKIVYEHRG